MIEVVIMGRGGVLARSIQHCPYFERMAVTVTSPYLSFRAKRQEMLESWPSQLPTLCRGGVNDAHLFDFVALGAPLNAQDVNGENALFHVESLTVIDTLLARGGEVNARDWAGCTVLHRRTHITLLTKFVMAGADVNAASRFGTTPLHLLHGIFPAQDRALVADLFLTRGARVNALDHEGRTPMDATGCPIILGALSAHGGRHATRCEKFFSVTKIRRAVKCAAGVVMTGLLYTTWSVARQYF